LKRLRTRRFTAGMAMRMLTRMMIQITMLTGRIGTESDPLDQQ
jgi:hypothetical protein